MARKRIERSKERKPEGSFKHKKQTHTYRYQKTGSGMLVTPEGGNPYWLSLGTRTDRGAVLVVRHSTKDTSGEPIFSNAKKTTNRSHIHIYKRYGPSKDVEIITGPAPKKERKRGRSKERRKLRPKPFSEPVDATPFPDLPET